jgi:precorrin-3B C17-methyltransferase
MKIYVVGIGPGNNNMMTPQAKDALSDSDVICGYGVYVDLVKDDFADKQFLTTPMKKEADRCRMAVEEALKGQTVSMVCSGDPGVYGMASLMFEVAQDYDRWISKSCPASRRRAAVRPCSALRSSTISR